MPCIPDEYHQDLLHLLLRHQAPPAPPGGNPANRTGRDPPPPTASLFSLFSPLFDTRLTQRGESERRSLSSTLEHLNQIIANLLRERQMQREGTAGHTTAESAENVEAPQPR
eukprot:TRINITY_DN2241_c0_g5_i2.p1 TRINITY_DN2241_c0_g5~~TRINITY_DN2241_c0_g5_i2.p1  ORF type:complete len:112 (+),score=15.94 TRINITY_DN2241_c0_g5_i2:508-843(+)